MPFIRITNTNQLPTEYGLKEVQPCPTFKQARVIAREAYRVIYYFQRRGFPPLLMEKKDRIKDHEYQDGRCLHCGQLEPEQPTAESLPQGNTRVTLTVEPLPAPPIDSTVEQVGKQMSMF